MSIAALAQAAARRIVRDRMALFFMVVLPILIIVIVGAVVTGGNRFRVGLVVEDHGALAQQLAQELAHNNALEIHNYATVRGAKTSLRRSEIAALIEIPAGTDSGLRAGRSVEIPVYGDNVSSSLQAASTAVASTVAAQGARVQAAHFAGNEVGGTLDVNLSHAGAQAREGPGVGVVNTVVDRKSRFLPSGFSYSAPTMLVLFVFINALAGGGAMIETRKLGLFERMNAAGMSPGRIVVGETAVFFAIALVQSVLIIGVGALAFGVHWGNAWAAVALVVMWALVGTGAGMLVGTLFATPEQTVTIAPAFGMVLGMLGGCMWPLEIVPPVMQTIGHFTPQAWAVDGWTELMSRGGNVFDIGRELVVLGAFAVVLIAAAGNRLRHSLSR